MKCRDKLTYHNELTAATAALECEFKRGVELFWYWCYKCEGYHLTHVAEGKDLERFRMLKAQLLKPKRVVEPEPVVKMPKEYKVRTMNINEILLKFKATPDFKLFRSVEDVLIWNLAYPDLKVNVWKVQEYLKAVKGWTLEQKVEAGYENI